LVVPPEKHGGQSRLDWGIAVSGSSASMTVTSDMFGNHVVELRAPNVAEWIEFSVWALVTGAGGGGGSDGGTALSPWDSDGGDAFLAPTSLTRTDRVLGEVARTLSTTSSDDMDFAQQACAWTHQALTYEWGVTSVKTDAASALSGGRGVCQDYAHIMLALCRAAGVPARYVSGHLLGDGGSHAWVEVLLGGPGGTPRKAVALDPTHNRPIGRNYLTIAVGRDYADVAPTSGTFEGGCPGVLSVHKNLGPVALDEDEGEGSALATGTW
jgi:transglutaminase-like putative cysteine protease